MFKLFEYYGRYQNLRGSVGQWPGWARFILALFAMPGIVLLGLSILALLVSLAALLLLTVPVYRLLSAVCCGRVAAEESDQPFEQPVVENSVPSAQPRRHIDVTIIE